MAQVAIAKAPVPLSYPSHPHPEPCTAAVLAVNSALKASKVPQRLSIPRSSSPVGGRHSFSGARLVQKMSWLTWPFFVLLLLLEVGRRMVVHCASIRREEVARVVDNSPPT